MKRVFSLLLFVFLTMSVVAQQRMNFLGQPLGCSISTFKQRMVGKGFKYKGEVETNIHYFDGVFGGEDVSLGVFVTPKSKIVYRVGVGYTSFSDYSDSTLEYRKDRLVNSFIKKYGNYSHKSGNYIYWYFDYGYIAISYKFSDKLPLTITYTDELGEKQSDREQESDY